MLRLKQKGAVIGWGSAIRKVASILLFFFSLFLFLFCFFKNIFLPFFQKPNCYYGQRGAKGTITSTGERGAGAGRGGGVGAVKWVIQTHFFQFSIKTHF